MLGLEGVGLDRLDGVLLDHVDVPHRRGMHDDVDVGHRVPQAGCIAGVACEDLSVIDAVPALQAARPISVFSNSS